MFAPWDGTGSRVRKRQSSPGLGGAHLDRSKVLGRFGQIWAELADIARSDLRIGRVRQTSAVFAPQ